MVRFWFAAVAVFATVSMMTGAVPVASGLAGAEGSTRGALSPALVGWGVRNVADYPAALNSGTVTQVAGGNGFAAALTGGKVVVWGGSNYPNVFDVPLEVQSGVAAISGAWGHMLALKDGKVIGWGNDGAYPVPEEAQSGVTAIAAGFSVSLALKDGKVLAWGDPSDPQMQVPDALKTGGVTSIVISRSTALAIKDGGVYAWGRNANFNRAAESFSADVKAVALGTAVDTGLALKTDGSVHGWGDDFGIVAFIPEEANSDVDAIALIEDRSLAVALKKDGQVLEWGHASGAYPVPEAAQANVKGLGQARMTAFAIVADTATVSNGPELVPDGISVLKDNKCPNTVPYLQNHNYTPGVDVPNGVEVTASAGTKVIAYPNDAYPTGIRWAQAANTTATPAYVTLTLHCTRFYN